MMTNLMTISVKKVSTSSKLTIVYLSCSPLCGLFSIQQNAKGDLSYKVKKAAGIQRPISHTFKTSYRFRFIVLTAFKTGHLDSASLHLDVFATQTSRHACRLFRKQASVTAFLHVFPVFSAFGQALDLLVTVSSMCCHTSTSALSTL